ncbi:sugar phosphate isomerase/epimerase [Erysipelothrix urinaevulpis]|uniref:sugar phosphate isomerase/epimerase family protein n=1 Tax=Erysipelothrix urinaevulpis TaxID=2683717 RepID=UPI001F40920D|nr:sugar phosphate isomerase/epimerase [Erysipelothrix urinaevulpis]
MTAKIALQLYSLRKEIEKDLEGTLKQVAEMGFKYVQVDGMRGNDMYEFANLLKKYELEVVGLHIKHDRFFNDLDGILEEAYVFNCKVLYDKYIEDEDQTTDGYIKTKEALIEAASKLSTLGFSIGLHCPEYDYNNTINGRKVMQYITDPVNGIGIYAEPDTYWMSIAGHDPLKEMHYFSGRMPIVHMKDCITSLDPNDFENNLVACGDGDVDFKAIIDFGKEHGVEYFCIEQDYSKIGMFNSIERSLNHLKTLL